MPSINNAVERSTDIELQLLHHIHRYRLTLPEPCARRFKTTLSEAQGVLDQLVRNKLLATAPFRDGSLYYHLTKQGAKAISVSVDEAKPLKVCHHAIAYGTLQYATMLGIARKRLTKQEFIRDFPEIYRPGPQINYVLQPDGKLSFVRLDGDISVRQRPGSWERLVETVKRLYDQRSKVRAFSDLIDSGYFNVVILTAMQPKVVQVRRLIQEQTECYEQYQLDRLRLSNNAHMPSPPPAFEIEHVPGLFQLMRPRPRKLTSKSRGRDCSLPS